MQEEILKGLSIEELEERAEFTAVIPSEADLTAYSSQEIAQYQEAVNSGQCTCVSTRYTTFINEVSKFKEIITDEKNLIFTFVSKFNNFIFVSYGRYDFIQPIAICFHNHLSLFVSAINDGAFVDDCIFQMEVSQNQRCCI